MILFTIHDLFIMTVYDDNGRKTPKYIQRKQRKKFPIWLPSHPPVYEMEADCFPVSENKPTLV